jgi:hypothetical protein
VGHLCALGGPARCRACWAVLPPGNAAGWYLQTRDLWGAGNIWVIDLGAGQALTGHQGGGGIGVRGPPSITWLSPKKHAFLTLALHAASSLGALRLQP